MHADQLILTTDNGKVEIKVLDYLLAPDIKREMHPKRR